MKRRKFLQQAGKGALGIAIVPSLVSSVPASDRLRVAHIGTGGMGNNHMQWFAALPEVEVAALCDVDKKHLRKSVRAMKDLQPGRKVDGYDDFRQILDRDDIDAITCATPDHWHAQIAIMAFQAGKDVYGEKPLSYDVREGQMMLQAMKDYGRVFQLGTQIHATDNYHRVAEIIQSGVLGRINTIRLWKNGRSPGLGFPESRKPPRALNWDMWLGPAPYVDYIPEKCHGTYRYFLDYSGGVYADFWCHIADIAFWAAVPEGLRKISAVGEEPEGIADAPEWIDVDFEFDNLRLYWTTDPPEVPGAADRNIGAYFEGEKGNLICDYTSREITINGETFTDLPEVPVTIGRSPGHQQNFVDAVKSRKQPESNLEYVRKMTLPMHLGLISWRLGRKLEWDPVGERFRGDDEANMLLSRNYRDEWKFI